ncbi:hypothetical protein, partial [Rhodoblastus sp.]|uniref:hypothetical protein n=1 Tax=Rhodoblastus sp. TaxID=1962975 RepID=UPI0035B26F07
MKDILPSVLIICPIAGNRCDRIHPTTSAVSIRALMKCRLFRSRFCFKAAEMPKGSKIGDIFLGLQTHYEFLCFVILDVAFLSQIIVLEEYMR